jgi:hypothetical protein
MRIRHSQSECCRHSQLECSLSQLVSIEIEQTLKKKDKKFWPSHFSSNPFWTPPFSLKLSFFSLINFPISMLALHCPWSSFFVIVRQEPRKPTLPLATNLNQWGTECRFSVLHKSPIPPTTCRLKANIFLQEEPPERDLIRAIYT